jgi:hypothetical protein
METNKKNFHNRYLFLLFRCFAKNQLISSSKIIVLYSVLMYDIYGYILEHILKNFKRNVGHEISFAYMITKYIIQLSCCVAPWEGRVCGPCE